MCSLAHTVTRVSKLSSSRKVYNCNATAHLFLFSSWMDSANACRSTPPASAEQKVVSSNIIKSVYKRGLSIIEISFLC